MSSVRYKPGEAVRWLESGAADSRKSAARKTGSLMRREGARTIGTDMRDAAGALVDLGKSALTELVHRQATASEYMLHDDHFEVGSPGRLRVVRYDAVRHIRRRGDRVNVVLDKGAVTIKPHAYIVAGRVRVPIGWVRGGIEVPYDVLVDELAGRCRLPIEEED